MGEKSLKIIFSSQFKKDLKPKKNKKILIDIRRVIALIASQQKLPIRYKDHNLSGGLKAYRECHIKPDLLLIYKVELDSLYLARLGSHSDLFK